MVTAQELLWLLKRQVKMDKPVVKHENPFKVLISTVISQRTRDENTAKASGKLFSKYSTPQELSEAPVEVIENLIKNSGYFRVKANYVKKISEMIVRDFGGVTPSTVDELLVLPGVGRKTANCVLVYGFEKPAIPVDVHVHRISNRIGIIKTETPDDSEVALEKFLPEKYWIEINQLMVRHGQQTCLPRNPKCSVCLLERKCVYGRNQK
ncbi:MAG: endonuclease III [Nanoarchaeota archaeon]|nr:endonuclease III [Nanoarchaeota archaeon]